MTPLSYRFISFGVRSSFSSPIIKEVILVHERDMHNIGRDSVHTEESFVLVRARTITTLSESIVSL